MDWTGFYGQAGQMLRGGIDGRRIAIQTDNRPRRANLFGERKRMPPPAQCAVNENAADLGRKPGQHFGKHYRHMNGVGGSHS